MPPPVFRFAPSPNGYLHLGHAYSALLNFDLARERRGKFLLRIEDIDATRCRPEYEAAIYQDLAWLGIAWETPVRRQSEHFAAYREAIDKLSAQGLIYQSFESRAEIARLVEAREKDAPWPRDPDGAPLYPGTAKSLSTAERQRLMASGVPFALRLDMEAAIARAGPLVWTEQGAGPAGETGEVAARPEAWGDVVLARKEAPTSYHLSARCRPEYEAAIYEDLAWLGIRWETPVRRQSEHFAAYRAGHRQAVGAGPDLSELREPRGDRATGGSAREGCAVAARSRRRAALSGHRRSRCRRPSGSG